MWYFKNGYLFDGMIYDYEFGMVCPLFIKLQIM